MNQRDKMGERMSFLEGKIENIDKRIDNFYKLLEDHMAREDVQVARLNKYMIAVGAGMILLLAKSLPWHTLATFLAIL